MTTFFVPQEMLKFLSTTVRTRPIYATAVIEIGARQPCPSNPLTLLGPEFTVSLQVGFAVLVKPEGLKLLFSTRLSAVTTCRLFVF